MMKQKRLVAVALFFSSLLGIHATEVPKSGATPNIVLIFIDDMGYADIGPFGNKQLRTPHLDKLASEGMKFTSFYAAPVCSMSRASMMTGCYNTRVSIPGVLFPSDHIGLNPSEITLAEVVKQKNYATCAIGKWHLGHYPEFLPTRQGFDEYFGLPYSNDMQKGLRKMPPLPLISNEKVIETQPDQSQLTRRYTEKAVTFIREHQASPFFVYLPHTMIHAPLAASEAFKGKSAQGLLGDAIEEIDWSVGQIMATLKELKLDSKTLVLFTSDNGPAGHRPAPPFRGYKGTNFEGGVRVPCIMRWPGKIPAGTACGQIVGNIDILPTFAKLVGVETPTDRIIDGCDITSLMFNPEAGPVRDTQLYFGGFKLAAIRQGDWKLFLKAPGDALLAQSDAEDGKKNTQPAAGRKPAAWLPGLYNLASDPGETRDVASENPEIVARLSKEAKTRETEILAHKRAAGQHSEANEQAPSGL